MQSLERLLGTRVALISSQPGHRDFHPATKTTRTFAKNLKDLKFNHFHKVSFAILFFSEHSEESSQLIPGLQFVKSKAKKPIQFMRTLAYRT